MRLTDGKDVAERREVRLTGAGTHGMIEAGLILQEAAAIYDDLNAHHVQSYGPEARSQFARSEVIISSGDIDYPKATQVDVLVATTTEALERYSKDLRPDALVIIDESVSVKERLGRPVFVLPLLKTAEQKLKKPNLLHVVALGALVERSGVVTKSAIEAAVKDHVPRGGEEQHLLALQEGYALGKAASPEAR